LALAHGGEAISDPYSWWDSLSDEAVEFWQAYWRVEPWGFEFERHAEQMRALDYIYAALVNQHMEKGKEYKPPDFVSHMPDDFYQPKTQERKLTTDEMAGKLDAFVKANSR